MSYARHAAEEIWTRIRGAQAVRFLRWREVMERKQRWVQNTGFGPFTFIDATDSTAREIMQAANERPADEYQFCEELMLELLTNVIQSGRADLLPTSVLEATKGICIDEVARQQEMDLE